MWFIELGPRTYFILKRDTRVSHGLVPLINMQKLHF